MYLWWKGEQQLLAEQCCMSRICSVVQSSSESCKSNSKSHKALVVVLLQAISVYNSYHEVVCVHLEDTWTLCWGALFLQCSLWWPLSCALLCLIPQHLVTRGLCGREGHPRVMCNLMQSPLPAGIWVAHQLQHGFLEPTGDLLAESTQGSTSYVHP